MKNVNKPCQCGSGRKAKKCCLRPPQPKQGDKFIIFLDGRKVDHYHEKYNDNPKTFLHGTLTAHFPGSPKDYVFENEPDYEISIGDDVVKDLLSFIQVEEEDLPDDMLMVEMLQKLLYHRKQVKVTGIIGDASSVTVTCSKLDPLTRVFLSGWGV